MADNSQEEEAIPTPPVRPERQATLRFGQRELSLITIAVVALFALIGLFAGWRTVRNFKSQRDIVVSKENLHAIYTALKSGYALDYESKLPPAANWSDTALAYLSAPPNKPGGKQAFLSCPGDGDNIGYVYNELAANFNSETNKNEAGKSVDPGSLVLLIERPGAPPNSTVKIPVQGSPEAYQALYKELSFPHFSDDSSNATTVVLYANGNISVLKRIDFKQ